MIIRTRAYPRAGLVGNPSDGYFGKTISFTFSNFRAEVELYETPELEILPCQRDHSCFASLQALVDDVHHFGYYGGIRLIKATLKSFHQYCAENGIQLGPRNFTLRYRTNIPTHVGLAGSSAIITAALRALMAFYQIEIAKPVQANVILGVERDELGIAAGLQDRVAQVYETLVYMDFDRAGMERRGHGRYVPLDPRLLPPLYIAYRVDLAEGSEVFHNDIRARFERGERKVTSAMRFWARLTDKVRRCLEGGDPEASGPLLDSNFDRRAALYKLSAGNLRLIDTARSVGASAKFAGSGGAIVGTYRDAKMLARLKKRLERIGVKVIRPRFTRGGPS